MRAGTGSGASVPPLQAEHCARDALLTAMVREVAELGYASATVTGACARAGLPQSAFPQHFGSKEECFLAAGRRFADTLVARVAAALEHTHDWREGVRVGLAAFLDHLAAHPDEARAFLVEALDAGPEAMAIRDLAMRAFAHFLDVVQQRAPEVVPPSAVLSEATVGGIYGIVTRRIRDGETSRLPELLSSLAYFLLAPIVGCFRARLEVSSGGW